MKGFSNKGISEKDGQHCNADFDPIVVLKNFISVELTRNKRERDPLSKDFEFSYRRFLWLKNTASHSHWVLTRFLIDRILSRDLNLQKIIWFLSIY